MKTILTHHYGTTIGPLDFPQTDKRRLDARRAAALAAEDARIRVSQGRQRQGADRTQSRRAQRRVVDHDGEHRPHRRDRRRPRHERRAISGQSAGDARSRLLAAAGRPQSVAQARPRRRAGRHQGEDAVSAASGVVARGRCLAARQVLALVQAGLLQGKSIGFLPTKVHIPDEKEVSQNNWTDDVALVIDEWLLLEYACVFLPANQDALVEAVSKGSVDIAARSCCDALGLNQPASNRDPIAFTPWEEIERVIARRVEAIDFLALTQQAIQRGFDKARGRI